MKKDYTFKEITKLNKKELKAFREFILKRSYPTDRQSDQLIAIEDAFMSMGLDYLGRTEVELVKALGKF